MAIYLIRQSGDKAQTTLTIAGKVTSIDWEALRDICLYTLKNKDLIVLDLEKVTEYDISLNVFVCLLRRTVQLLGKQVMIVGREEPFACQRSNGAQCPNIETSARCWCESILSLGGPGSEDSR
jgi:anti-anti-sigma regulatory factor